MNIHVPRSPHQLSFSVTLAELLADTKKLKAKPWGSTGPPKCWCGGLDPSVTQFSLGYQKSSGSEVNRPNGIKQLFKWGKYQHISDCGTRQYPPISNHCLGRPRGSVRKSLLVKFSRSWFLRKWNQCNGKISISTKQTGLQIRMHQSGTRITLVYVPTRIDVNAVKQSHPTHPSSFGSIVCMGVSWRICSLQVPDWKLFFVR